jgi:hypothetical protein
MASLSTRDQSHATAWTTSAPRLRLDASVRTRAATIGAKRTTVHNMAVGVVARGGEALVLET